MIALPRALCDSQTIAFRETTETLIVYVPLHSHIPRENLVVYLSKQLSLCRTGPEHLPLTPTDQQLSVPVITSANTIEELPNTPFGDASFCASLAFANPGGLLSLPIASLLLSRSKMKLSTGEMSET